MEGNEYIPAVEKGVSCIAVAKEGGAGWNKLLVGSWNRYIREGGAVGGSQIRAALARQAVKSR